MRDFLKTSALFLGLAGCGDGINDISPKENDNEAPPRVIMRVSSAPGKIRGTTEVEGSTVHFSAEEGDRNAALQLKRKTSGPSALISVAKNFLTSRHVVRTFIVGIGSFSASSEKTKLFKIW